jgi:hypothetical protein
MHEFIEGFKMAFKPLPSARDRNEFLLIVLSRIWVVVCIIVAVSIIGLAVLATI